MQTRSPDSPRSPAARQGDAPGRAADACPRELALAALSGDWGGEARLEERLDRLGGRP